MKTTCLKVNSIALLLILALGCVLTGCKKETPPPEETSVPPAPTQDETAKEKEFLSDPNVVSCQLEETTISKIELPKNHMASFIRRMERDNRKDLKVGTITLADRPHKVVLGGKPEREFYLYDVGTGIGPYWWGSWSLHSHHQIDDTFYEFTLIEKGTKLAARPYKGELGTFKVGKGNRELEKVEFKGSVFQEGSISAPIGIIKGHRTEAVTECTIPIGDYTSYIMHVTYDNLDICISNNYHTNAEGQSRSDRQIVYGFSIREDQPYVLDFSNKPVVVFDQPRKDKTTFKRGEEIKFASVLVDPKLDIMIRGLDDTSVKVDKEYKNTDGQVFTVKRNKSLDPKVVISRTEGEIVAEGVMPFG
jgi:hypothetical protein